MSAIEIRLIDECHKVDIHLPNEPFPLFGRMVPSYTNETWDYTTEPLEPVEEMCFPDENYCYEDMASDHLFIGAYDGEQCVGLAILRDGFFKYMYLYDLKVNREHRRQGVAKALLEKAVAAAKERGFQGLYTQGQDNNLGACLFYVKQGFVIGGLDTKDYQGTPQEGKKDILFYWDF